MEVPAHSFPGVGSPPGLQTDVFLLCVHMAERESSEREGGRKGEREKRERELDLRSLPLLIKTLIPSQEAHPHDFI